MPQANTKNLPRAPLGPQRGASGLSALLVAGVILTYMPTLFCGFIWDDDSYLLNNALIRSWEGLLTIWTQPRSVPQWYPMVFTTFGVEYQLWGLRPAGFHALNVLLHAGSAVLLWRLLVRLDVPGAFLAACLWAVHPVNVESVAWITERKNTLSAVLYVSAFHALWTWGRANRDGRAATHWYAIGFLLFVLALLSKSVTASLPAAYLLATYWVDRRIRFREVAWLVPLFLVGLGAGLHTAELERSHVGASGAEWNYSPTLVGEIQHRAVIAGRSVMFYLASLGWPVGLLFIYPRFEIHTSRLTSYFPLLVASAVVVVAIVLRSRGRFWRGTLVAALFFGGTLLPALGFFNVFPHRYSFVADHFQYLACIGVIAWFAAVLVWLVPQRAILSVGMTICLLLAILSLGQMSHYRDALSLWQHTLAGNPGSWMVHLNLGHALGASASPIDRATADSHYLRALELHRNADTLQNAAGAFVRVKQSDRAEALYLELIRLSPYHLFGRINLANLRLRADRPAEALEAILPIVDRYPKDAELRRTLGQAFARIGRWPDAMAAYSAAYDLLPLDPLIAREFADVLIHPDRGGARSAGDIAQAGALFERCLQSFPNDPHALAGRGDAAALAGDKHAAGHWYERCLKIDPGNARATQGLAAIR